MVQIENSECREGVPSPGEQREEEHIIKRSPKTKSKSPKFLGLSLSTTSLVLLPKPASVVIPLGAGVEIHPVDDRVDAAIEDGGQVDDVLDQAWDHL